MSIHISHKYLFFDVLSCHRSMKMNILRDQIWYSGMDTQQGRQVCMILPVNTGSVCAALQPLRKQAKITVEDQIKAIQEAQGLL